MKLSYYSNVSDNGKLQISVSNAIREDLKRFCGKRVEITIGRYSSKRSHQQNNYVHLLFTIFTQALNELGAEYTMHEIKEMCKKKFATVNVYNKKTGEIIGERVMGTSEMSKIELNEFFEKVIMWAADMFNIVLPYPNEELEIDFND
jgi:hypothetical protein